MNLQMPESGLGPTWSEWKMMSEKAVASLSEHSPGLAIQKIVVRQDRVICDVVMGPGYQHYTDRELLNKILPSLPSLVEHSCKNSKGTNFASVMNHTSIPHLLEHMVIDLQSQSCSDKTKTFVGTTKWTDERRGTATIEVSFTEDLSCLRAFCDATRILNNAMI